MAKCYEQVVRDLPARDGDTANLVARIAEEAAACAATDTGKRMSMQLQHVTERVEHKQGVLTRMEKAEAEAKVALDRARIAVEAATKKTQEARAGLEEWQHKHA